MTLNANLLLLVLVHLAESQKVFNQKHEVDAAQCRQAFPYTVQVLLVLPLKAQLLHVGQLFVVVVVVASLSLQSANANKVAHWSSRTVSTVSNTS